MHYSRTLVLAFAGLGLASPSPSPFSLLSKDARIDPSLKLTDHTAHIDLANFEKRAGGSSLEKRRNVDICTGTTVQDGGCVNIVGSLAQVSLSLATLLKTNSDRHDCTAHVGATDRVIWKVYAVDKDCATSAQLKTLNGAIAVYFESVSLNVCGVHCLKLTHGGGWVGFAAIAPEGSNLDNYYCGDAYSFDSCITGGGDNVP